MSDKITWVYPTAQDLANATIRIENVGLQSVFMTIPTNVETGERIGNIKRIQIDMDVDKNGNSHITAKVTLHPFDYARPTRLEEVTLENNPDLLLDVVVTEVEMRWKQSDLWRKNNL